MLVACLPLLLIAAPSFARDRVASKKDAEDIAALLEPIRKQAGIPGMAGAVIYKGVLVAAGATGVRAEGNPAKVTIADKWHVNRK